MNFRSPTVLTTIGVVATLVLALAVVVTLLLTGGSKALSDNAALIGALVALGGVFTAQLVSIALDDRRSQQARALEAQRAGEAALQRYLEDVGELLIEKPLRRASLGDNLSTVVRAQTLVVLEGLDPDRKGILVRFLHESALIQKDRAVVSLLAANLRGANLRGTDLRRAYLRRADLRWANLSGVTLFYANLSGADLRGAYLNKTDLRKADLGAADLSGADLSEAYLMGANLHYAKLRGANLSGADLSKADLGGAEGITNEQLEQQAASLEGATMVRRRRTSKDLLGELRRTL